MEVVAPSVEPSVGILVNGRAPFMPASTATSCEWRRLSASGSTSVSHRHRKDMIKAR